MRKQIPERTVTPRKKDISKSTSDREARKTSGVQSCRARRPRDFSHQTTTFRLAQEKTRREHKSALTKRPASPPPSKLTHKSIQRQTNSNLLPTSSSEERDTKKPIFPNNKKRKKDNLQRRLQARLRAERPSCIMFETVKTIFVDENNKKTKTFTLRTPQQKNFLTDNQPRSPTPNAIYKIAQIIVGNHFVRIRSLRSSNGGSKEFGIL
jgi:hypothetical protein